jgi:hypothetical protein
MITTHKQLTLVTLDAESRKRTCGYWYLVRETSFAHTAFRTRAGLLLWLAERGIRMSESPPDEGVWSYQLLIGEYRAEMHHSFVRDDGGRAAIEAFEALAPVLVTRTLSNGDYVVAKITRDADGIRTVHTLNPNVPRQTFDYVESNDIMDGDRTVAP